MRAQMVDEQKKKPEQKLWDIANTLRGKMGADGFRDDILGFIFYKYLSERMNIYADRTFGEDESAWVRRAEAQCGGFP